jgi:hypothetical protein
MAFANQHNFKIHLSKLLHIGEKHASNVINALTLQSPHPASAE